MVIFNLLFISDKLSANSSCYTDRVSFSFVPDSNRNCETRLCLLSCGKTYSVSKFKFSLFLIKICGGREHQVTVQNSCFWQIEMRHATMMTLKGRWGDFILPYALGTKSDFVLACVKRYSNSESVTIPRLSVVVQFIRQFPYIFLCICCFFSQPLYYFRRMDDVHCIVLMRH